MKGELMKKVLDIYLCVSLMMFREAEVVEQKDCTSSNFAKARRNIRSWNEVNLRRGQGKVLSNRIVKCATARRGRNFLSERFL